jgi:hypothetical protein
MAEDEQAIISVGDIDVVVDYSDSLSFSWGIVEGNLGWIHSMFKVSFLVTILYFKLDLFYNKIKTQ